MNAQPLYQLIASLVGARANCMARGNHDWQNNHTQKLQDLCKAHMPSGSGVDIGTKLDLGESTSDKLVFSASFHHMDEHGGYDGWTDHKIIVTPSLQFGFNLKITGRDRNQIKDYLSDIFHTALTSHVV